MTDSKWENKDCLAKMMIVTRVTVGLATLIVSVAAMLCLYQLDWGFKYHGLGPLWAESDQELPTTSKAAMALAPIGRWSGICCLFAAIGCAFRVRSQMRALDMVALLVGSALFWISTVGSINPFFMTVYYMGYPTELVTPLSQWIGNLFTLAASSFWMLWAIRSRSRKTDQPNKSCDATGDKPTI